MLQVQSFTKKYGKINGLDQTTLTIEKGSIHGLVGKNGAGKTTLLKAIMGIYKGDQGTITWDGKPIYEAADLKQKLYFIPDFPYFSFSESLNDLAKLHRNMYPNWSEERYQKLVKGLELKTHSPIKQKSKGEQSQMSFCLALSAMPELLVLDEPFDGLDAVIRHQIKNLLIQDVAERQLSVVVSSHNLRELDDLCDSVTLIHDGRIQLSSDLDELKDNIFKIQVAFNGVYPDLESSLDILYKDQHGSILTLVIRGEREQLYGYLQGFKPKLLEILPLSLEELFIYEMEGLNYERKNIIL